MFIMFTIAINFSKIQLLLYYIQVKCYNIINTQLFSKLVWNVPKIIQNAADVIKVETFFIQE